MAKRIWLLGARGLEMAAIEGLLLKCGEQVMYAEDEEDEDPIVHTEDHDWSKSVCEGCAVDLICVKCNIATTAAGVTHIDRVEGPEDSLKNSLLGQVITKLVSLGVDLNAPIVTLSNGLRVANFSSPHSFKFDDGTILPGCTSERAKELMLECKEIECSSPLGKDIIDIELEFSMSDAVHDALCKLERCDDIDVVLVPLPVMQASKKLTHRDDIGEVPMYRKIRVCRVVDRVEKTISSSRFCR